MNGERTFITRSSYQGSWSDALKVMEGFGTYTYPDGSEYRGYFRDGQFEGYGTLKIAYPQKFIIKGDFKGGSCKYIHELRFGDGLKFRGHVNKNHVLKSDVWSYCNEDDRRFYDELRYGIEPYGPHSITTGRRTMSRIPKGTYDTVEGFYQPHTGFLSISENTGENAKARFIACPKDRAWITRNCRLAERMGIGVRRPIEPNLEIGRKIVQSHLASMCEENADHYCTCRAADDCERHFDDMCLQNSGDEVTSINSHENHIPITPSSSSVPSINANAMDPRCSTAKHEMKESGTQDLSTENDRYQAEKIKIMKYIN